LSSVKSRRLHCERPVGAYEQASWISRASCSPSSFVLYSRSGALRWTVPRAGRASRSAFGFQRPRPRTAPAPRRFGRPSRPGRAALRRPSRARASRARALGSAPEQTPPLDQ
jgi:hypothetical protein